MRLLHAATLTGAVLAAGLGRLRPGSRRRRGQGEGEAEGHAQAGEGLHGRQHRALDGAGVVARDQPAARAGAASARRPKGDKPAGAEGAAAGRGSRRGQGQAEDAARPKAEAELAPEARPGPQGRGRLPGHGRQAPARAQRHERSLQPGPRGQRAAAWRRTRRSSPTSRRASRPSKRKGAATAIAERAPRAPLHLREQAAVLVELDPPRRLARVELKEPPSGASCTVRVSVPRRWS